MRPTQRTLLLAGFGLLLGLLCALLPSVPGESWQIYSALLAMLLLVDGVAAWRLPVPQVSRHHADNLALGNWSDVQLQLQHDFRRAMRVAVFDHYPESCLCRDGQQNLRLIPGQGLNMNYQINPRQRGQWHFGVVDLLLSSPLGLWRRRRQLPCPSSVRVYPNFTAVSQFAMLNMEQQTAQMGLRRQQRRGEGMDFQQLREFRQGDSLRQIEWNASARHRKLISKEYQDEKDQQILFMVDCGRRMRSQDGDYSQLDHALNAMLLMSYAALKQGDAVGLQTFGGSERWLKPLKGIGNLSKILNISYDIDTSVRASDYSASVRQLVARQRKRALIVLLSNIRDENLDDLLPAIKLLQSKHLVMVANLEEPEIVHLRQQPVQNFASALRYTGAVGYLEKRQRSTLQLNRMGVLTVNSTPQMMPTALVNKYFEIKRKGIL